MAASSWNPKNPRIVARNGFPRINYTYIEGAASQTWKAGTPVYSDAVGTNNGVLICADGTASFTGIAMKDAAAREWSKQDKQIDDLKTKLKDDPEKLSAELEKLLEIFRAPPRAAYYKDLVNKRKTEAEWNYRGAQYAFAPKDQPVAFPGHPHAG